MLQIYFREQKCWNLHHSLPKKKVIESLKILSIITNCILCYLHIFIVRHGFTKTIIDMYVANLNIISIVYHQDLLKKMRLSRLEQIYHILKNTVSSRPQYMPYICLTWNRKFLSFENID